jgi:hypothetical protein
MKMLEHVNKKHVRKLKEGRHKKYSCCARTGWFCSCPNAGKSDIADLGPGVSSYFKMLKFFIFLYFWFSFLSIPAYYFYATGNETKI